MHFGNLYNHRMDQPKFDIEEGARGGKRLLTTLLERSVGLVGLVLPAMASWPGIDPKTRLRMQTEHGDGLIRTGLTGTVLFAIALCGMASSWMFFQATVNPRPDETSLFQPYEPVSWESFTEPRRSTATPTLVWEFEATAPLPWVHMRYGTRADFFEASLIAIAPDASRILYARDHDLRAVDADGSEIFQSLPDKIPEIASMAFEGGSDEQIIVLAQGVYLLDLSNDTPTLRGQTLPSIRLSGEDGGFGRIVMSQSGRRGIVSQDQSKLTLFGPNWSNPFALTLSGRPLDSVTLSDDGEFLAYATSDALVVERVGETAPANQTADRDRLTSDRVSDLEFSNDNRLLAIGYRDGSLALRTQPGPIEQAAVEAFVQGPALAPVLVPGPSMGPLPAVHAAGPVLVSFSPHGDYLASLGAGGRLAVWDLTTRLPVYTEDLDIVPAALKWARDGGRILAVDAVNTIVTVPMAQSAVPPPAMAVSLVLAVGALAAFLGHMHSSTLWFRRTMKTFEFSATLGSKDAGEVAAFLQSDQPLDDANLAGERVRALVNRLSLFMHNRDTSAPLTFALEGGWGSGKSSIMSMVAKDLAARKHPYVWFNAWHHQTEEHLFAALMEAIRSNTQNNLGFWERFSQRLRLAALQYESNPVGFLLRIFISVFFVGLAVMAAVASNLTDSTKELTEVPRVLAGAGLTAVSALIIVPALARIFSPFGIRPIELLKETGSMFRMARFKNRLDFRYDFGTAFGNVTKSYGDKRLVLIIDDLDRCKPAQVADVLEAINFLVASGKCFVILGISREPVLSAVGLSFQEIAHERALLSDDAADQDAAQSVDVAKAITRREFAERYLEKLVNIRVQVPKFDESSLSEFMHGARRPEPALDRELAASAAWKPVTAVLMTLLAAIMLLAFLWEPPPAVKDVPRAAAVQTGAEADNGQAGTNPPQPADNEAADGAVNTPDTVPSVLPVIPSGPDAPVISAGIVGSILLALTGGLIVLAGLQARRLRRLRSDSTPTGEAARDSDEFLTSIARWAPILMKNDRFSPRTLKRFTNWIRFLVAGLSSPRDIDAIAMFGALEVAGKSWLIENWETMGQTVFDTELNSIMGEDTLLALARKVDSAQRDRYRDIRNGVEYSG